MSASKPDELYDGLLAGNRAILAKAITLAESNLDSDRIKTEQLLKRLLPNTGHSLRVGITGVPGVGKSTFIEAVGELATLQGNKVAVLAIDPTSQITKGSILGDKTRMETLSRNPNVFIRPTPSGLALGGVSYHTRETILLCEAAGFNIIFVETIGVGQSETLVRSMVDFFLLLIMGGAGDELQGIKKGIMEMVDAVAVNKTDGDNVRASTQAKADALNALHLQRPPASGWKPEVMTISALEKKNIHAIWEMILRYKEFATSTGFFKQLRESQKMRWLDENLENNFREFMNRPEALRTKDQLSKEVMNSNLLPSEAARKLWNDLLNSREAT